jgi:beta-phosphoglucomutase-like phosphatase (HAD superfamily)
METSLLADLWRGSSLILFDFDGVLADSEPFYRRSWNMALEPWGHIIPEEDYWLHWTQLGEGLDGEMERNSLRDVDPVLARSRQRGFYDAFCRDGSIPLYEGVKGLFTRLCGSGSPCRWPVRIASNTPSERISVILEGHGVPVPPVTGGEGLRSKPFPDIFLKAAEDSGADPAGCLVFEDALKGVRAAGSGGFPVVLVENRQNRNMEIGGILGRIDGIGRLLDVLDLLDEGS